MNYGKKGIIQKKKVLTSSSTKLGTKFGVAGIKLLFIAVITIIVAGSCLALGAAQGIIASAPDVSTIDVSPEGYATRIYDAVGNETQALSTTGSNRISVDIENVPLNLQHAFIAIEDERFYEHNGIDIKGIVRAASLIFTNGEMSQGASTITQQLLKNNVFKAYNETKIEKIKRKVQEQYLAVKLETVMDKQTILENYLNTINLGNGYYGVQSASKGYFGKDVSDLTISECAVIASITQSPSKLNPAKSPEKNQERQRRVLKNMYEQGYITKADYDEALADDVYARIQSNDVEVAGASTYSYFVDTVIEKVVADLQEQKGYTESQASNLIYKGGLSIYTTQDMDMQAIADDVINDPDYYPANTEYSISYNVSIKGTDGTISSYSHYSLLDYFTNTLGNSSFTLTFSSQEKAQSYVDQYREYLLSGGGSVVSENLTFTLQPQMSFTLIEQSTGYVKVIVGGRGEKSGNRTLNRATSSTRQPGSSIKPLVAYGPAIDIGAISLATPIDDAPYYYSGEDARLVKNYTEGQYRGLMSVRTALKFSQNVPAVKVLTQITPQVGFNYLTKLGISSLVSPKNAINGNHDVVQSLALGGMTLGVYNIDMTSAYSAIANGGVRVTPIYYTKVTDREGNVILDNSTPEKATVFKKTSAWLLTSGLESVVNDTGGTGGAAKMSSQPVAGKTGTTQFDSDKWFCGFTPYYTASIWLGYDDNSKALPGSINHTKMWKDIMERIHAGMPTGTFEKPDGIEEAEVCSQSGKLAVPGLCDQDPRGSQLITDYFATDQIPTETCDIHIKVTICNDTGKIARSGCTNTTTKIMIKKSAINTPTDAEGEAEYTTWDQAYSITQDELNSPCDKHSGTSTYNGSTGTGSSKTNGTTGTTTNPTKVNGTTSATKSNHNNNSSTTKSSNNTASLPSNTTATTKSNNTQPTTKSSR